MEARQRRLRVPTLWGAVALEAVGAEAARVAGGHHFCIDTEIEPCESCWRRLEFWRANPEIDTPGREFQ